MVVFLHLKFFLRWKHGLDAEAEQFDEEEVLSSQDLVIIFTTTCSPMSDKHHFLRRDVFQHWILLCDKFLVNVKIMQTITEYEGRCRKFQDGEVVP